MTSLPMLKRLSVSMRKIRLRSPCRRGHTRPEIGAHCNERGPFGQSFIVFTLPTRYRSRAVTGVTANGANKRENLSRSSAQHGGPEGLADWVGGGS